MRVLVSVVVLGLAIMLTDLVALSANDPMDGTWDLDAAASRFDPGPERKSDTRTYTVEGNSIRMTATVVFADGRSWSARFDAALDGKDYPATGNPRVETIAQVRIDDYTVKATTKRNAKVTATSTRQVSKDGRTMTIHTSGTDEKGVAFNNRLVFRKRETR